VLAITPGAAEAISGILSASELPEGAGLRITSEAAEDESGAARIELRLSLAEQPEEGDQVVEGDPVFIESEAASFLDDKLTSQATRPSSASASRLRRNKQGPRSAWRLPRRRRTAPSRWRIPNGVHRGPDRAGDLDARAVGIALDLKLDHGGGSELRPARGRRVRVGKQAMPESITSDQVVGAAQDLAQAEFARGELVEKLSRCRFSRSVLTYEPP
jgi:iron-sulfur cluster assembly protein